VKRADQGQDAKDEGGQHVAQRRQILLLRHFKGLPANWRTGNPKITGSSAWVDHPRRSETGQHADAEMSMPISIFGDRDEQLVYYVMPETRPLMGEQVRQAMPVTGINQAGVVFLWPIKQASEGRGSHAWADSGHACGDAGEEQVDTPDR
jgi:hypothetical protein